MKRVFLDTNVVLDYILLREPWYIAAQPLWDAVGAEDITALTSAITPMNISYIARKVRSAFDITMILRDLYDVLEIILLDESVLRNGLSSPLSDYEDVVNEVSALAAGVDVIITRDLNDFQKARLPVLQPSDFVKQYLKS
jgi:predicted nucleic acid-binding protein